MDRYNLDQDKRLSKHVPLVFECYSKEQIKDINTKIHDDFLTKKQDFEAQNGNDTGKLYTIPLQPMGELLHQWVWNCQRINQEVFGFDIYWNFDIEVMNYNIYGVGDEHEWHTDEYNFEASDIKLTCLLNLSEEPYEGGEFHTIGRGENNAVKFESGMGMVFHSPIFHKITPITKGEKITLRYWGIGPAWK